MKALGTWGERWMELAPEHLDPGVVLHSWVSWHLGRIEWADALRAERIRVLGPSSLARALPTWSRRSAAAHARPTAVMAAAGTRR